MRTTQAAIDWTGHGRLDQTSFMIAMMDTDRWWSSIECRGDWDSLFAIQGALQDQLWFVKWRVMWAPTQEAYAATVRIQHERLRWSPRVVTSWATTPSYRSQVEGFHAENLRSVCVHNALCRMCWYRRHGFCVYISVNSCMFMRPAYPLGEYLKV